MAANLMLFRHSIRSPAGIARLYSASSYVSTHPTLRPTSIDHHHPSSTTSAPNIFRSLFATSCLNDRRLAHHLSTNPLFHHHRPLTIGSPFNHRPISTTATNRRSAKSDRKSDDSQNDAYVMNLTVRDSNIIKPSPSDRRSSPTTDSTTDGIDAAAKPDDVNLANLGLIARFKALYKQYWYVMLPVHVVTSTGWMVGFYYMSKSGVDVPEMLRALHVSETIVSKIADSPTGHLAIAYLCYKVATPLRYTVTIGGTTISIKYLSQWGYIKPMPSAARMREIYDEKADQMKRGYEDLQDKAKAAMHKDKKDSP